MKVDVIIIGSGIAGLAIGAALGRQKLKALVIGPDIPGSNYDYEYIFENSTITTLPSIETFDLGPFIEPVFDELSRPLLCVDSKALYQRLLMSCANNGVGMMHGRAENVVSYRKLHRVDWVPNQVGDTQLPKEELFAPLVIDASGGASAFSPKSIGFSSTYRKIFRGAGNLFVGPFGYFDFSDTTDQYRSFCRGFGLNDGRWFLEETRIFSEAPESEQVLSERLAVRLGRANFTIDEDITSSYYITPLFTKSRSSKILAFGDAASMAHPLTGEATSRILNIAPKLAKVIAESIEKSPQEIVDLARKILFSQEEKKFEEALAFVAENIFSSSYNDEHAFFDALYSSAEFFDRVLLGNKLDFKTYAALVGILKISASKKVCEKFTTFEPSSEK